MRPRTANKRVPLSCENCRRRKIACSGGQVPCHTCTKRGLALSCRFLKDTLSQPQTPPPSMSSFEQESLLNRISTLERLLQENIESTRRTLSRNTEHEDQQLASPYSINNTHSPTHLHTGQLVHYPSGHVRFMPANNVFQELTPEDTVDPMMETYSPSTDFPFSTCTAATTAQILELLPPLSYCDELKGVFFDVFSPLFHVLHDPTFEDHYDAFRRNPKSASLSFLALVFVVLAIAVTALDDDHHLLSDLGRESTAGANARDIASRFRNAAMRALSADSFLWRHNLHTLQTLVLLIYALSHAHGPAWSLLGTTLNIAIAIGCHIDPSSYDVSIIEGEERRRCWAALTMLYTIQDTCMGNLSPMNIQADIKPPADLDDDLLACMQSPTTIQPRATSNTPSKMTYILHKFRLYRLASEICSLSASGAWEDLTALSLDRRVATEETNQKQRFGNLDALPLYHQAHYYILSSYTNHLYVILHRPCLNTSVRSQSSLPLVTDDRLFSMQRLRGASSIILTNYEILHSTPTLRPYKWYTYGLGSFHAFLAATTLATIVVNHSSMLHIDRNTAFRQLRQCLKRFEEASERSDICAKAARILQRFLIHQTPNIEHPQHRVNTADGQGFDSEGSAATLRGLPLANVISEGPGPGWASNTSVTQPSTSFASIDDIDVDGWTADSDLQNVFTQIPSQQWLSPSSFPWWRWNDDGPTM